MGAMSGNQLQVKTRAVQAAAGPAGVPVTDADAWMDDFAGHGFSGAKEAFDAATGDEKATVIRILVGADEDVFAKQSNLQNYISDLY